MGGSEEQTFLTSSSQQQAGKRYEKAQMNNFYHLNDHRDRCTNGHSELIAAIIQ